MVCLSEENEEPMETTTVRARYLKPPLFLKILTMFTISLSLPDISNLLLFLKILTMFIISLSLPDISNFYFL